MCVADYITDHCLVHLVAQILDILPTATSSDTPSKQAKSRHGTSQVACLLYMSFLPDVEETRMPQNFSHLPVSMMSGSGRLKYVNILPLVRK